MANKNKIVNAAQKFISKGQWDKAVKELQKAVALDPSDVRTLLKLGDVFSKKGDRENATATYRQVADSYSEQGFFLKAVAVHKQILKHDTNNLEVRLKLAELYEQLGLASEAHTQYQEVARIHDESGDAQGSLEVLKRLVELDADNVASRIKLAEGYSRANLIEAAVEEFARATDVLKRQNRLDDYVKVAERLVFHDPDRVDVIKDLARIYLQRGDTKRGLAKLQTCFKTQPRDIETLTLLAQAFQELGQVQKTKFVFKELASVYQDSGLVEESLETHRRVLAIDPEDPEARAALGVTSGHAAPASPAPAAPRSAPRELSMDLVDPAPVSPTSDPAQWAPRVASRPRPLASGLHTPEPYAPVAPPSSTPRADPAPPFVPSAAPRPAPPRGPSAVAEPDIPFEPPVSDDQVPILPPQDAPPPPSPDHHGQRIQDLLHETSVFVRYGLTDRAMEHLRSVLSFDPDRVEAYEKMRDIYLQQGDEARAAEAVANIMHVHARLGDDTNLELARGELARLAPGHPLAHGGLPGAIPRPGQPSASEEDDLSIDITEDSGVFDLDDFAEDPGASAAPISELSPEAEVVEQDRTDAHAARYDLRASEEDLLSALDSATGHDAPAFEEPEPYEDEDATLAVDPDPATHAATEPRPLFTPPDSDPFSENVVTELPELVPLAEGPFDEDEEDEAEEVTGRGETLPPPDVDDEIEEALFFIEAGLLGDARDTLSLVLKKHPDHAQAKQLLQQTVDLEESDVVEGGEAEGDGFEGGTNTAQVALSDIEGEAPADLGADLEEAAPTRVAEAQVAGPLGDLAADEPTPEELEDAEEQYNLGMVMMDTMQLDAAIAHFERASRSPERVLSALEMLGTCHRRKGEPLAAIEYYAQALARGADGLAAASFKYEIGAAHEEAGALTQALEWMEACLALDADHRDAAQRVRELIARLDTTSPAPSPAPRSGKKNKISYL